VSTQNGYSLATFLIETESQNIYVYSKKNMAVMASNGPSPHSPSLRLSLTVPPPSRRCHAQSLLSPSFSWHKNASCSRIPPWASRASLPPRRWATTYSRLSLRPCLAPLSCSLQPRLKLSLLSLGPSLLQFVSIVALLLNLGNLIFESVSLILFLFCFRLKPENSNSHGFELYGSSI